MSMLKRPSLQALGSIRSACGCAARVGGGIRYRRGFQSGTTHRASDDGDVPAGSPAISNVSHNITSNDTSSVPSTRRQRAAKVSDELRALSGSDLEDTDTRSPYPSIQSSAIDAEALNPSISTPEVSEPATLESPQTAVSERKIARAVQHPEAPEAPEATDAREPWERGLKLPEPSDDEIEAPGTQHELILLDQYDKQDVTSVPFEHDPVTKEEFLHLGQNGATIAAGNFQGVLEDRLRLLAEPTQDGFRYAPDIAKRMLKGQFVSFQNEEEKAAVLAAAEKVKVTVKKEKRVFAPVATSSQEALLDALVRGKYADPKATPYKQAVLNDVARYATNNPTYLSDDQSKLIKKIRSLLPAEGAAARRPAPAPKTALKK